MGSTVSTFSTTDMSGMMCFATFCWMKKDGKASMGSPDPITGMIDSRLRSSAKYSSRSAMAAELPVAGEQSMSKRRLS